MKPPSRDEHRSKTVALINAFITSATSAFAPLVGAPGGTWSVRVEQATANGIVEVAPENVAGLFFVTGWFSTPLVRGHIAFGDRELSVDTVVGPATGSAQYGLWEWADAAGRSALVPRGAGCVTTVDRLEGIVAAMAAAVRALESEIASPTPALVERIDAARARVQEEYQARLREDDHRRAAARAAEAFRAHDYRRVVTILGEIEGSLSPAEREKLAYARRHL